MNENQQLLRRTLTEAATDLIKETANPTWSNGWDRKTLEEVVEFTEDVSKLIPIKGEVSFDIRFKYLTKEALDQFKFSVVENCPSGVVRMLLDLKEKVIAANEGKPTKVFLKEGEEGLPVFAMNFYPPEETSKDEVAKITLTVTAYVENQDEIH